MARHGKPRNLSTVPSIQDDFEHKKYLQKQEARIKQKIKGQEIKQKIHRGKQDHYLTDATIEDDMIAAIDFRKDVVKLKPILEKLVEDKFDPTSFFSAVSKFAAAELASVAFTGEKEKNRLDALKHLLALGGHTATQKHEISRIDPNTEKEALMSIVRGAQKDLLAEGIEIVDDSEDYDS
jgi:hypothetical protein